MKKVFLISLFLFSPLIVVATDPELVDPGPVDNLGDMIMGAVNILLIIAGVLAIFYIVLSGVRMITSGGNMDRIKKAKSNLFWAVIGLAVILLSYVILNLITASLENIIT